MSDGSPTRLWHQVRDQLAHAGLGAILMTGWHYLPLSDKWDWLGVLLVLLIGTGREVWQWPRLNTPSLWDSILDISFWLIGALLVWWLI